MHACSAHTMAVPVRIDPQRAQPGPAGHTHLHLDLAIHAASRRLSSVRHARHQVLGGTLGACAAPAPHELNVSNQSVEFQLESSRGEATHCNTSLHWSYYVSHATFSCHAAYLQTHRFELYCAHTPPFHATVETVDRSAGSPVDLKACIPAA